MEKPLINIPKIELFHGSTNLSLPVMGFGCYKLKKESVKEPARFAYDDGYRFFDTAQVYQNEKQLGEALDGRDWIVLTKLWRSHVSLEKKDVEKRLKDHVEALGRKVNIWIMHWPGPGRNPSTNHCSPSNWSPKMRIETWRAMVECWKRADVDAIGVSNFRYCKHSQFLCRLIYLKKCKTNSAIKG